MQIDAAEEQGELRFGTNHFAEHLRGDARLVVRSLHRFLYLPAIAAILLRISRNHTPHELAEGSLDAFDVFEVSVGKTAGDHAADVGGLLGESDGSLRERR